MLKLKPSEETTNRGSNFDFETQSPAFKENMRNETKCNELRCKYS